MKSYLKILISLFTLFLFSSFMVIGAQTYQRFNYDANYIGLNINTNTTEKVNDPNIPNSSVGITLKAGIPAAIHGERAEPDVTITFSAPEAGRYVMRTLAVTDAEGDAFFESNPRESVYMRVQYDNELPANRVIAVPWKRPLQTIGKYVLKTTPQQVKIWLPRGVRFGYLEFYTYTPPKVPDAAINYIPPYSPCSHPRLWISESTLPELKNRLKQGENYLIWKLLQARSTRVFQAQTTSQEQPKNKDLEDASIEKAFNYLMTGNEVVGREAVSLIDGYLPWVHFDNILDNTRHIGETIYASSLVYDWCFPLLTSEQKARWITHQVRLAEDMEVGWPPFAQPSYMGHGNEAQMSRDLLAMAIATADEHPDAFKYCSFSVLEELIPVKKFEFQSPRHPQGGNYGIYRSGWDLHAAWMYRILAGRELFDPNIKNLFKFWTYMRTPDGQMLRDGDGFSPQNATNTMYYSQPLSTFLAYTYSGDPFRKGEFIKQGGSNKIDPYLFLLLNDPQMNPVYENNYPLTFDFGDITGGMLARTGWNSLDDVVVEIKGGGYRNGGHQHSDVGAIQLYYRGFLFGDIGMYLYAGTPFDESFNRRSVAHSMMLVKDPNETFGVATNDGSPRANDGGQRYNLYNIYNYFRNNSSYTSPVDAIEHPDLANGKVVSCSFGPSASTPAFSYFSVDAAKTYTSKVSNYVRSFCFLNLNNSQIPGVIILTDDITSSDPSFKKSWQLNSIKTPIMTTNGLMFESGGLVDKPVGKCYMNMLIPKETDRTMQILSGKDVHTIDGVYFEPPAHEYPEKYGNRMLISPNVSSNNKFLTILQITDGVATPLPVNYVETSVNYIITIADRIVGMSNSSELIKQEFSFNVLSDKNYKVALTGLATGDWQLISNGSVSSSYNIKTRENSIFMESIPAGSYTLKPISLNSINMTYDNELNITQHERTINIKELKYPIIISDTMGRILYFKNKINEDFSYTFNSPGIFFIKAGFKSVKIIVR